MATTPPTASNARPHLRQTDFLPTRFSGDRLDRDNSTAHFLSFTDYLEAQDIDTNDPDQLTDIVKLFKRTLQGHARLWIDGLTFFSYTDLNNAFIRRFSPAKSTYSQTRDFNTTVMTDGESTEAFLQRLRQTATQINYGETQVRHRLLEALPNDCRAAILLTSAGQTNDEIAAKAQLYMDLKGTSQGSNTKELTFCAQSEIDQIKEQVQVLKLQSSNDNRGRSPHRRPSTPRQTSDDRSVSNDRSRNQKRSGQHLPGRNHDNSYRRNRQVSSERRYDDRYYQRPRPRIICNYCRILSMSGENATNEEKT